MEFSKKEAVFVSFIFGFVIFLNCFTYLVFDRVSVEQRQARPSL